MAGSEGEHSPEASKRIELLVPEKDYMFDSSLRFRRKTQAANAPLEPIVKVQHEFLRRGGGNGGSPTNFGSVMDEGRALVPVIRT